MTLPVHEGIFKQRCHCIDVVLAHLSNVLKQERKRLEDTILNIELRYSVLIHEGWQHGEGRTGLRNNGNSDSGAHPVLTLLYLKIVQQSSQYILGTARAVGGGVGGGVTTTVGILNLPNGLCYVAKGVDCCSTNSFLVCLQQLQQLETDPHPLLSRHEFSPSVSYSTNQINTVLLNLLMTVGN